MYLLKDKIMLNTNSVVTKHKKLDILTKGNKINGYQIKTLSLLNNCVLKTKEQMINDMSTMSINDFGRQYRLSTFKVENGNCYGFNAKMTVDLTNKKIYYNNDDYYSDNFVIVNNEYLKIAEKITDSDYIFKNVFIVDEIKCFNPIQLNNDTGRYSIHYDDDNRLILIYRDKLIVFPYGFKILVQNSNTENYAQFIVTDEHKYYYCLGNNDSFSCEEFSMSDFQPLEKYTLFPIEERENFLSPFYRVELYGEYFYGQQKLFKVNHENKTITVVRNDVICVSSKGKVYFIDKNNFSLIFSIDDHEDSRSVDIFKMV